jgi:hypothetical protein
VLTIATTREINAGRKAKTLLRTELGWDLIWGELEVAMDAV